MLWHFITHFPRKNVVIVVAGKFNRAKLLPFTCPSEWLSADLRLVLHRKMTCISLVFVSVLEGEWIYSQKQEWLISSYFCLVADIELNVLDIQCISSISSMSIWLHLNLQTKAIWERSELLALCGDVPNSRIGMEYDNESAVEPHAST